MTDRRPWANSTRRTRLPRNWRTLRRHILARDPVCQLQYDGCTVTATDVDHITPGDNHNDNNLQGACHPCHAKKTIRERGRRAPIARPTEAHPGMLR